MGRVGDGGGLRLERQKERGQEAGGIASRRLSPRHQERAITRMLHADSPAGQAATWDNSNAVLFHSPGISKSKNECFLLTQIFPNMEVMPPNLHI